jgi:dolichyl-diphosphooligosaccharide--protein glycosyltransferase/undecaprenyl-diphosphooligosaccharide--protein glycosyltransferase
MLGIAIEIRVALFFGMLLFLYRVRIDKKLWIYLALASFLFFLFYGNILSLIVGKISVYVDRGVESNGLHFYQVIQTVREAGSIPMKTVANRISGSSLGLLLSLIGYVVLVMRHKPFLVAMPLIGVGLFSYVGGLRFTVYAVPVVAISIVYLFYIVGRYFKDNRTRNIFMIVATTAMLYPNFTHILEYKVPTVLNNAEVQDLKKLQSISHPKDYTLAWWDYGYPIWFYSNTNTLIDGGKHTKDNFVVSKILQTTSPVLAANLGRVAVETYVDTNYTIVGDTLFKNGKKDQVDPNFLLSEIETDSYILPTKTRDVYLYLPYRMLNIFPTVALFGNLDLMTGKAERKMNFYPTEAVANVSNVIKFRNGIRFNTQDGNVILGQQVVPVKYFIVTQNTQNEKIQLHSQLYHTDGKFAVVYMKSYNRFVIMDIETFKSMYVQMFILGKYDKNLFELVVSSPYSRIYKIKK